MSKFTQKLFLECQWRELQPLKLSSEWKQVEKSPILTVVLDGELIHGVYKQYTNMGFTIPSGGTSGSGDSEIGCLSGIFGSWLGSCHRFRFNSCKTYRGHDESPLPSLKKFYNLHNYDTPPLDTGNRTCVQYSWSLSHLQVYTIQLYTHSSISH